MKSIVSNKPSTFLIQVNSNSEKTYWSQHPMVGVVTYINNVSWFLHNYNKVDLVVFQLCSTGNPIITIFQQRNFFGLGASNIARSNIFVELSEFRNCISL